jgi:hypothetical protein
VNKSAANQTKPAALRLRSATLIGTAPDAAKYSSARVLFGAFASMAAIDSEIRERRR